MTWLDRVFGRNGEQRQQEQIKQSTVRVTCADAERLDQAVEDSRRITALLTELASKAQHNGA